MSRVGIRRVGLGQVVERLESRRMLSLAAEAFSSYLPESDWPESGYELSGGDGWFGDVGSSEFGGDWQLNDGADAWELEQFPPPPSEDSAHSGPGDWWDAEGMLDIDEPDLSDFDGPASGPAPGDHSLKPDLEGSIEDSLDSSFDGPVELHVEPGSQRDTAEVLELLGSLSYRPNRFDKAALGGQGSLASLDNPLFSTTSANSTFLAAKIDEGLVDIGFDRAGDSANHGKPSGERVGIVRDRKVLDLSVKMESDASKFQAFEMLTVEESPADVHYGPADASEGNENHSADADDSTESMPRENNAAEAGGMADPDSAIPGATPSDAAIRDAAALENNEVDSVVALERRHSKEAERNENRPSWVSSAAILAVAGVLHTLRVRMTRRADDSPTHCEARFSRSMNAQGR